MSNSLYNRRARTVVAAPVSSGGIAGPARGNVYDAPSSTELTPQRLSEMKSRGIAVDIRKVRGRRDVLSNKTIMRLKFSHDDQPDEEVIQDAYSQVRIADGIRQGDPVRQIALENGSLLWDVDVEAQILMREELDEEQRKRAMSNSKRIQQNAYRLLSDVGLDVLKNQFPLIQLSDKADVTSNQKTLMTAYKEWCMKLHPKMHTDRVLATCKKLGSDKEVVIKLDSQREEQWNMQQDELAEEERIKNATKSDYMQRYDDKDDDKIEQSVSHEEPGRKRAYYEEDEEAQFKELQADSKKPRKELPADAFKWDESEEE